MNKMLILVYSRTCPVLLMKFLSYFDILTPHSNLKKKKVKIRRSSQI